MWLQGRLEWHARCYRSSKVYYVRANECCKELAVKVSQEGTLSRQRTLSVEESRTPAGAGVCLQNGGEHSGPGSPAPDKAGAGAEAPPQRSAKQLKKDAKKGTKLAKYNEKMQQEVRSHINYR